MARGPPPPSGEVPGKGSDATLKMSGAGSLGMARSGLGAMFMALLSSLMFWRKRSAAVSPVSDGLCVRRRTASPGNIYIPCE